MEGTSTDVLVLLSSRPARITFPSLSSTFSSPPPPSSPLNLLHSLSPFSSSPPLPLLFPLLLLLLSLFSPLSYPILFLPILLFLCLLPSLKDGYLSPSQLSLAKQQLYFLLKEVRKEAVPLVDAFDLPDEILNSVLGRYDGDVYTHLYEWAQKAPRNKKPVRQVCMDCSHCCVTTRKYPHE